ncbi:hydantoinase/oxoprolinase family protein [Novosphingobium sp. LASN5T]|uniref:hydantoinase/oxoprolinase family protein n=1 Tax=Novosphingobium sp. LASN5T TaxID=2491021 RepID=UPI000F5E449D|nr:hydantoinase/oxoprolinase family protein [Novosphingobium sp. LASN5T]RQW46116.1 hydantoinase/oxoprolinase family protein [Novosphingobium sp. LASN5T]
MWRVGVDVGGTFTDLFAWDDESGQQRTGKVLTTRPDRSIGVIDAIEDAGIDISEISHLIHGTTTATNALIERSFPDAAFITTEGFRDTIEIGRQHREHLYDPYQHKPAPVIRRRYRYPINERINREGVVERQLDESRAREIAAELKAKKINSIGIGFINSYASGLHEERMADILREYCPDAHIILSSETRPVFREHGRFMTTAIRTALMPVMSEYFDNLEARLAQHKFHGTTQILKSSGGIMTMALARKHPEEQLESGPAGGVAYAAYLAKSSGFDRILHTDVGGTSFDVSIVEEGKGLVTRSHELQWEVPIIVPMLDIHSVGAGGGSIGWVDPGGALRVGPKSAGSLPGPACYGRGGAQPTITDANLVLGRLEPTLSGKMQLDLGAAEKAVSSVAEQINLPLLETAEGMIRIGCEYMAQAVKKVLISRGRDPRDFIYVAFGGAGALHACFVAKSMNIPKVLLPPNAGVASACGATVMDFRQDIETFYYAPISTADLHKVNEIYEALELRGKNLLREQGVEDDSQIELIRTAQMRYVGQSYEVETPIPSDVLGTDDLTTIANAFHKVHESEFGVSSDDFEPAFVSLSVAAIGKLDALPEIKPILPEDAKAQTGIRDVFIDGEWVTCKVYNGEALAIGAEIDGPAIVDYEHACAVLPTWSSGQVNHQGALVITLDI